MADFENVREEEILSRLKRRISQEKAGGNDGADLSELRNLTEEFFQQLALVHHSKDPSIVPHGTRLRLFKRIIQRMMRTYTQLQVEFNRAVTEVVNAQAWKTRDAVQHLQNIGRRLENLSGDLEALRAALDRMGNRVSKAEDDLRKEIREENTKIRDSIDQQQEQISRIKQDWEGEKTSLYTHFTKEVQNLHTRLDDEKKSLYSILEEEKVYFEKALETEKKNLYRFIEENIGEIRKTIDEVNREVHQSLECDKGAIYEHITSQVENLHNRIDDEKKSHYTILEDVKKSLVDRLDWERNLMMERIGETFQLLQGRIEEEFTPKNIFRKFNQENSIDDTIYFNLEEKYRGTHDAISERQHFYREMLSSHHASLSDEKGFYLDVGCGRGEMLSLMKEEGIPCRGVDNNLDMVRHCEERGLNVKMSDALEYLGALEDDSLRGIISLQVIEHLSIRGLFDFFDHAKRKLRPDGIFVVETVNPESVYALRWFYMDYTHNKPLPAPLVRFLLLEVGFREAEVILRSPVEGWKQLSVTGKQKRIDENFHKLNNFLFVYQDYAIKALK